MVVIVSQNGSSTLFQIPILPPCQHPKFSLMAIGNVKDHYNTLGMVETRLESYFLPSAFKGSAKNS